MQRRSYCNPEKQAVLLCSNSKCNNVSSKLCIVENKIIDALKIWLKNYKIDYTSTNHSISDNNKIIELCINNTKKDLEKENVKLNKVYDFLESGIYNYNDFINRSKNIKDNIQSLENKLEKYTSLLLQNTDIQNHKKIKTPKLENVMDLYYNLETAEDKNVFLKSLIRKVTYIKYEKSVKKFSDPTNFELHIYPKLNKK